MVKQLKSRQICLFIIALLPIYKFFMMPSIVAGISKNDMWISALVNILINFITLISILSVCKKDGRNFYSILEDAFGKKVSDIILFLYLIFFVIKGIFPINEQKDYIELTLYVTLPNIIYFLPFFAVSVYFCTHELRVIGRVSDIFWIFTLLGYSILFVLAIGITDFTTILPVFRGGKILKSSYVSSLWFSDCAYLLFFVGEYEFEKKSFRNILLSFLVYAVMIIIFYIVFYGIFYSTAFRQTFAFTETSKYSTVINYTDRFDYLGIYCLLFSNIFSLCLPLFFACKIADRIFNIKKKWLSPLIINLTVALIIIFGNEYFATIQRILTYYCSPIFIIFGCIIPLVLPLIARRKYETR